MTLPGVVIDLRNVFAFGQLYTAVSRVRNFRQIKFIGNLSDTWKLCSPKAEEFESSEPWIAFDNAEFIPDE